MNNATDRTPATTKRSGRVWAMVAVTAVAAVGLLAAGPEAAGPTSAPASPRTTGGRTTSSSGGRSTLCRRSSGGSSDAAAPLSLPPTTGPSAIVIPLPKPMGPDYDVLRQHSIFVRQRPGGDHPPGGLGNAEPRPRTVTPPPRPESSLVFNGVLIDNGTPVALIEDMNSHKETDVKVGDKVATGNVTAIEFDAITYVAGDGKEAVIGIGQPLDGSKSAPSYPAPAGGWGGSGKASLEDIEARLRRKAAESRGKPADKPAPATAPAAGEPPAGAPGQPGGPPVAAAVPVPDGQTVQVDEDGNLDVVPPPTTAPSATPAAAPATAPPAAAGGGGDRAGGRRR